MALCVNPTMPHAQRLCLLAPRRHSQPHRKSRAGEDQPGRDSTNRGLSMALVTLGRGACSTTTTTLRENRSLSPSLPSTPAIIRYCHCNHSHRRSGHAIGVAASPKNSNYRGTSPTLFSHLPRAFSACGEIDQGAQRLIRAVAGAIVDEGGDAEVEEGHKVAIGRGMASMLSAVVDVLC